MNPTCHPNRPTEELVDRKRLTPSEIQAFRREMGLTQSRMASELGCDLSTYRNYEKGRTTPPGFLMLALAQLKLRMEEGDE